MSTCLACHTQTHTEKQVADFLAPKCKICLIAENVEDIEKKRLRCSQGLCGFASDRHKDYVALSRGLLCDCATDPSYCSKSRLEVFAAVQAVVRTTTNVKQKKNLKTEMLT